MMSQKLCLCVQAASQVMNAVHIIIEMMVFQNFNKKSSCSGIMFIYIRKSILDTSRVSEQMCQVSFTEKRQFYNLKPNTMSEEYSCVKQYYIWTNR